MEDNLILITLWIARIVELLAALVIGVSSLRAIIRYARNFSRSDHVVKEENRLELGRSLAIALELLLGADILKTVVAPNWHELGMLAAIAILRTGLNYFLDKELKNHEERLAR